jgi:hypothetical protein
LQRSALSLRNSKSTSRWRQAKLDEQGKGKWRK